VPPGQGWTGRALLAVSVAGVPLVRFAARRFGRRGGLLVAAGCGLLFARDVTMTAAGAPARLRALPRFLLIAEAAVSGLATVTGLSAWARRPGAAAPAGAPREPAAARVAAAAATATLVLHTAREAIYLSPGHGRR